MLAVILAPLAIAPFILFTSYSLPSVSGLHTIAFCGAGCVQGHVPSFFLPLKWLSPFWWGFNALTANEFDGLALRCTSAQEIEVPRLNQAGMHRFTISVIQCGTGRQVICRFGAGAQVLDFYSIDPADIGTGLQMLAVVSLLFRLAAFAMLKLFSSRVQPRQLPYHPPPLPLAEHKFVRVAS